MKKFTKGLIAGSVIGVAGVAMAITDKKSRSRIVKNGIKKMENM